VKLKRIMLYKEMTTQTFYLLVKLLTNWHYEFQVTELNSRIYIKLQINRDKFIHFVYCMKFSEANVAMFLQ